MGQIYRIQTKADGNIISSPDCRGYPFSWAFQEKIGTKSRKSSHKKKRPTNAGRLIWVLEELSQPIQ
jgi:hypothetical protein